ncbi:small cell adhesion glycoprotein, partial [Alca torda]
LQVSVPARLCHINPRPELARGHHEPRPAGWEPASLTFSPLPLSRFDDEEELTTPVLKKAHTPPLHEDANTVVIAGRGSPCRILPISRLRMDLSGLNPAPLSAFPPVVVITLVFLTLLTVLVVIIIYLYRNKGSYLTYEQPAAETDVSVQMEDAPSKEKEEYFI